MGLIKKRRVLNPMCSLCIRLTWTANNANTTALCYPTSVSSICLQFLAGDHFIDVHLLKLYSKNTA